MSKQFWINVRIKPLSINKAWKGRRFKTREYKQYEKDVLALLPNMKIPDGDLQIEINVFFSNNNCDVDNVAKPFIDILQKKYKFNDNRIYRLVMTKYLSPKKEEALSFIIEAYNFYKLTKNG